MTKYSEGWITGDGGTAIITPGGGTGCIGDGGTATIEPGGGTGCAKSKETLV